MANVPVEFSISVTGEVTGEKWAGSFKAKPRLSHRDVFTMDQFRRDLVGSSPGGASQAANANSAIIAKIWVHLVSAPSWWEGSGNGLDLLDQAPIVAVYDKIMEIEQEAIKSVKKAGEEAAKKLSENEQ